jgi:hypothetical protein
MRKCVFLFLLLVFVLIIASVIENRDRVEANDTVAMENNTHEAISQDDTALYKELP